MVKERTGHENYKEKDWTGKWSRKGLDTDRRQVTGKDWAGKR